MPIDYSKRQKNWLSEIRPRILLRANNTCEFEGCTLKHLQIVYSDGKIWYAEYKEGCKPVKVILTIAHLDHDECNHDVKDERLMAMCQRHHLLYDKEEKKRRRLLK